MSFLFLDFSKYLANGPDREYYKGADREYYNSSLKDQFKKLQERYQSLRVFTLSTFINQFFPSGLIAKYTFSCSNFLRDLSNNDTYLKNVVIRPAWNYTFDSYLPKNQNIMLIGDIKKLDTWALFIVKGIELIDKNMNARKDITVETAAVYCFDFNVWSIRNVERHNTVLTADFIAELMEDCYTVEDEKKVRAYYDKWSKYLQFRFDYIKEQEKRHFHIDNAIYCDSYAVNKKEYRRNSNIYEDHILDGNNDLKFGDTIVLDSQIENAEEFPLIRLDIDRNKSEFLKATEIIGNKSINKEERAIRSLARDNVFITQDEPTIDEKGHYNIGALISRGFILGDRFKISKYEVEPLEHIEELKDEEKEQQLKANKLIDLKYRKIIEDKLRENIEKFELEEKEKNNQILLEKKELLNSQLDKNIKENKDSKVLEEIKKISKNIKKEVKSILIKDKKETQKDFDSRVNKECEERISQIDLRELYVKRIDEQIKDEKSKLETTFAKDKTIFVAEKQRELTELYKTDLIKEQYAREKEIHNEYEGYINKIKESETLIRFSLYFRVPDTKSGIEKKEIKTINNCQYICYDSRAETSKINRQSKALKSFFSGYVKNPYLSTYLFDPDKINETYVEEHEINYNLPNLNDAQKKAVNSALSSNGLFLLQGPPGTGKTHVIAELVSQYVMRGKKVLISSETHKAIDNVFERLPKIADIVPIRLIPTRGEKNKNNDYDPTHLMDNFYENISHKMKKSINIYENYNSYKEKFDESFKNLKIEKQGLDKSQKVIDEYETLIKKKESIVNKYHEKNKKLTSEVEELNYDLNKNRRTKNHINRDDLKLDDELNSQYIVEYRDYLLKLFDPTIFNISDFYEFVSNFKNIDIKKIEEELLLIKDNNEVTTLELNKNALIAKKMSYLDYITNEPLPGKEDECREITKELIKIVNKLNALKKGSNDDLEINQIFKLDYINNQPDNIISKIREVQKEIDYKKNELLSKIGNIDDDIESRRLKLSAEIANNNAEIRKIHNEIQDIKDEDEYKEINKIRNNLDRSINNFIKDLNVNISYTSIDDALEKIDQEWKVLSNDFKENEAKNKLLIPMYRKISNYVTQEAVIEGDKPLYTKAIFESANVFGITCTSNDRFNGSNMNSLSEFNIDDVNIKELGIDVVIIDEVSKSSFIDLLIPILYGKTVILVGDHRQLPPMYDLAKLGPNDFEALSSTNINEEINKEFTALYEECFFKKLFEDIHPSFKVMLNRQYRCHGDIMDVFNHFYNNELKIGESGQNNKKKHNIDLMINGRTIISPDKHIYFINCNGKEMRDADSTSKSNTSEARVVTELIKNLIAYYKGHDVKDRLSLGVICTYRDQARKIRDMMREQKLSSEFFTVGQERQIINTVDDFQGDERDIIILSTVRNPDNPNKSNPEFILAYQRINVALSRARRLLIIVGNKNYLETKGVIDLPAIDGIPSHDLIGFRLYEAILNTIQNKGKLLEETDIVLEEKEDVINA